MPDAGTPNSKYTDERLYQAIVECVTKHCEGNEEADPKILAIGAQIIKDRNLKPLDLSNLSDTDPAAKRAAQLAKDKGKS